ncbi:sugar kinase [Pelagerythrobacter marensis]|uniref:2-dehydro-3-deoxygluconokinase n=1 Tax=Pelagerythrobacter marensis TaxID=543877 RepID=A0A0G3XBM8_9SPHN|nr:sugar kinase [Pelagerythrobacter marensis]AKM07798.1 2-dehydro-3-deoxygluconokinase [Pelagerythrobacter marensis]
MKIFIFGEAMLEYHSLGGAGLRYGGDTLNTAIHMARRGLDVAYVTAVGTDPISDALVRAWQDEGIDVTHVHRHPDRSPGIYAIHLDQAGERSFLYWRDHSAAREMFALPAMAATLEQAQTCDLVYFSLISLAVVGDSGQRMLLDLARTRKAAGRAVAYDSNYRLRLWPDAAQAQAVSLAAAGAATLGLPTNVDEHQLFADDIPETGIAARWHDAGCPEVIVKAGERGCYHSMDGQTAGFPVEPVSVVDSSGAGDAFNAGYLHARLTGADRDRAIAAGQRLAAETLGHLGAIQVGGQRQAG